MGTRPVSDNLEELSDADDLTEAVRSPQAPTDNEPIASTSAAAVTVRRTAVTATPAPPKRRIATSQQEATTLTIQLQREVLESLQQLQAARDSCDGFGMLVASHMREIPADQWQETQGFILYLMQMATPPNSPAQLHAIIDQHRHAQIQRAAHTTTHAKYSLAASSPGPLYTE